MNTGEPGQTRDGDHRSFGIKIQKLCRTGSGVTHLHIARTGAYTQKDRKVSRKFRRMRGDLHYDLEATVQSGPTRVAIVGTGGIARVHAAALRAGPATAAPGTASGRS